MSDQSTHKKRQELLQQLRKQFIAAIEPEIRRLEVERDWLASLLTTDTKDAAAQTQELTEALILEDLDSLLGRGE